MIRPTLKRERALWAEGRHVVAGLDEVGRGPIAGPVVAAAVVFPPGYRPIRGLRDSKLLTAIQRAKLVVEIRSKALAFAVGAASVREIERINIRCASALAMRRALERLPIRPDYLLIDGLALPELGAEHEPLVHGDALCHSIAAASVLAKETRDRLMRMLSARYPSFGWEENKGYATADHLAALDRLGPTRHHRYGFIPVAQLKLF
ncbi:MAG: ribonuclease HII [Gemmatimonadetes bacterium]|nr:ribonuclease HII [Gemmatimonadota bacterium]